MTVVDLPQSEEIQNRINQAIKVVEESRVKTRDVLRKIDDDYRQFIQSNISYHACMMNLEKERGDLAMATHHKILTETYQFMLDNCVKLQ